MAWNGYSEQGQGSEERGPATFAVNVPGVVQKPEGVEFVGVRASGNMQSSGRVSVPTAGGGDNTLGELAKLGQAFLAPKIKEEQDRRFVQGMAQAASGQAMQEIIAEQPAYVTIFGEAPAVEGARAYTTAARKAAWVAEQQNNMANLAKVDGNEVPALIYGTMQAQMTGDPITDADIQKELLGAMPDLIRTQTKARFLHLQGEAKAARRTAMAATYQEYASMNATGPELKSVDQMERAEENLIQIVTPPPGVDLDSHMDDVTETLVMDIQGGNFDALRLMYNNGVTKALGPDREHKLRIAALRAAPDALKKAIPELANDIVALGRNPPATSAEYFARLEAINDRAAGITRVPREYGQLLSEEYGMRGLAAAASDVDRRTLAHSKEAAEKNKAALIDGIITSVVDDPDASGDLKFSTLDATMPGIDIKPKEVDAALGRRIASTPDPRAQANLMNKFSGTTITVAQDLVRNLWSSTNRDGAKWETHGAQFGKLLQLYEGLDDSAKSRYFTKAQQDDLDAWAPRINSMSTDPEGMARDMQALYESRNTLVRTDTNRLRDEPDAASAQGAVMKVLQDRLTSGMFRGSPLDTDRQIDANVGATELQAATAIVLSGARGYRGPAAAASKANRSLDTAISTGIMNVHGGRLIFNEQPEEALRYPLSKSTGQNADSSGMALEKIISARVKARNGDDDTRMTIRAPGLPIKYIVTFEDKDGKQVVEVVRAEEVKASFDNPEKKPSAAEVWEGGRLRQKP